MIIIIIIIIIIISYFLIKLTNETVSILIKFRILTLRGL
jgi:hypothetical protein